MKLVSSINLKFRRQSGLTMVEILVASALLLVISLGLTAMLLQTQKAFRAGVKQVDILDSGRAAMDLITRDIEHAMMSDSPTNRSLFAGLPVLGSTVNDAPGGGVLRTNFLHDLFLLRHASQWEGIGYRVVNPKDIDSLTFVGVGTLYRYVTNRHTAPFEDDFFRKFAGSYNSTLITNNYMYRVIDGVVHLHARMYDANGKEIVAPVPGQIVIEPLPAPYEDERLIWFNGTTLPAMVEVELGVLEPQTYEQLKPLLANTNDPTATRAFIQRNGGRIHLFRQQIPIRVSRQ